MAAIADLIPSGTFAEQDEVPGVEETQRDTPHPFWGDPPDYDTCQQWMQIVLRSANKCQEELAFASKGGRVVDQHGIPLRQEEYAQWRRDKVGEWNRKMARYRMLKAWKVEATRTTYQAADAAKADKAQRSVNGYAIRAAMKRYGKLENVMDALVAWLSQDTDETWGNLLEAVRLAEETE